MRKLHPVHLFYASPVLVFILCGGIYLLLQKYLGSPVHHIIVYALLALFTLVQFLICAYIINALRGHHSESDQEPPSQRQYRNVVVLED